MKVLILLFVLLIIGVFLWANNAFAYTGVSESATMLIVGLCLVFIAGLGRKKFFKK